MSAASFDTCYAQICAALEVEPVALEPDDNGVRAFTVTYRQVEFSFTEHLQKENKNESESMSMLVRFGTPPPDKTAEILGVLMGVNFSMIGEFQGTFAQAPETGDIYLHRSVPLRQIHVPAFKPVLDQFVDQVERWSSDYFLTNNTQDSGGNVLFGNLA